MKLLLEKSIKKDTKKILERNFCLFKIKEIKELKRYLQINKSILLMLSFLLNKRKKLIEVSYND